MLWREIFQFNGKYCKLWLIQGNCGFCKMFCASVLPNDGNLFDLNGKLDDYE